MAMIILMSPPTHQSPPYKKRLQSDKRAGTDIYGAQVQGYKQGKGKSTASETPMLRRAPTASRLVGDDTNQ